MGHTTTQEALLMRWAELCADTRWDDMPGKASGALEGWIVKQTGEAEFFDATGRIERSRYAVTLPPTEA